MYNENVKLTYKMFGKLKNGYDSHLKVIEEMAELNEVLIKMVMKTEGHKPPIEKVIEEMGDVKFRIDVLAAQLGITDQVEERKNYKGMRVKAYIDRGDWKKDYMLEGIKEIV